MSLVLIWGARIPTVRIGRVAGQYGKPRSSPTEVINGQELLSFKGDNINGFEASAAKRAHDPQRLVDGHFHSACTLNYIRALIKGGYAVLSRLAVCGYNRLHMRCCVALCVVLCWCVVVISLLNHRTCVCGPLTPLAVCSY